jgi:hypothetical protein
MAKLTTEDANALLPAQPTKAPTDPRRLKYLMIGPPKWGKTTLGCAAPDSLLLATEEGHLFHETHKIIIDSWDKDRSDRGLGVDDDGNHHLSMVEAVEAICASDRFQFIVIDTADMAAKLCLDWHYKKLGVNHASDAGDYGKGWDLCLTQPFRQQIGALMKSGRGIMFITHTNVVTKKVGNTEQSRQETTLPSQVQKFLHTQADLILHGNFGKKRKGMVDRDRIISLDGTNEILAGSRVRGVNLPKRFIVDPEKPWQQWTSFFEDEQAVLDAEKFFAEANGIKVEAEAAAEPAAEAQTLSEPAESAEPNGDTTPATTKASKKAGGRK